MIRASNEMLKTAIDRDWNKMLQENEARREKRHRRRVFWQRFVDNLALAVYSVTVLLGIATAIIALGWWRP